MQTKVHAALEASAFCLAHLKVRQHITFSQVVSPLNYERGLEVPIHRSLPGPLQPYPTSWYVIEEQASTIRIAPSGESDQMALGLLSKKESKLAIVGVVAGGVLGSVVLSIDWNSGELPMAEDARQVAARPQTQDDGAIEF